MILFVFCVLLLLYAIIKYSKGGKNVGFIVYFFFLTSGCYVFNSSWLEPSPITKFSDFALLYFVIVCFINLKNKSFWHIDFKGYKWIAILLMYITFSFFITLLLGREEFGYAVKTYRTYIPLLSFFLLKELNQSQIKKVYNIVLKILLFAVFMHILQPILGITTLNFSSVDETGYEGSFRYRNIPSLGYYLLILYTVKMNFKSRKNILILLMCLFSLVISQWRAAMIGYVVVTILFMLMTRQVRKIVQFGVIGVFFLLFAGGLVSSRFQGSGGETSSDINVVSSITSERFEDPGLGQNEMGTFTFRVLLMAERIKYLTENPSLLVFGIGTRHEDSPRTESDFNFVLGTAQMSPTGELKSAQIGSGDMAWLGPLMLFGLIGLYMYIKFTLANVRYFKDNWKRSDKMLAAYLLYLMFFVTSISDPDLFSVHVVTFFCILIEYFRKVEFAQNAKYTNYHSISSSL